MMGRTHKVGGVLAGAVASRFFYSNDMVTTGICIGALIFGSVLGSLLPDIDKKESTIGRQLWFVSWPIYLLRMIIKLLAKIFPGIIKKAFRELDEDFGHRGIAHSLITWAALTASLWFCQSIVLQKLLGALKWIPWNLQVDILVIQNGIFAFMMGITIGMLSHIVLDLLTAGGVALFSPFIDTKYEILFIRTGSFVETAVRDIMAIATAILTYREIISFVKA